MNARFCNSSIKVCTVFVGQSLKHLNAVIQSQVEMGWFLTWSLLQEIKFSVTFILNRVMQCPRVGCSNRPQAYIGSAYSFVEVIWFFAAIPFSSSEELYPNSEVTIILPSLPHGLISLSRSEKAKFCKDIEVRCL